MREIIWQRAQSGGHQEVIRRPSGGHHLQRAHRRHKVAVGERRKGAPPRRTVEQRRARIPRAAAVGR